MIREADFASTGAESERASNRAFLLLTCLAGYLVRTDIPGQRTGPVAPEIQQRRGAAHGDRRRSRRSLATHLYRAGLARRRRRGTRRADRRAGAPGRRAGRV